MKHARHWLFIGLCAVALAYMGCNDSGLGDQSRTTDPVTLSLSSGDFQKDVLPKGQSLEIATYDVTGTGPDGESLSLSDVADNESHSVDLGRLAIGGWEFSAQGKNAEGTVLATGSTTCYLAPSSKTCTLVLDQFPGSGSLSVSLSWSKAQVDQSHASVKATLTGQDGTVHTLSQSLSEGGALLTAEDLPSGSYILSAELLSDGSHVSGATSAVRIVSGGKSEGSVALVVGDRSNTFTLKVENNTSLPIQGSVTCTPETPTSDTESVTLTFTPTNLDKLGLKASELTYAWYHEGVRIEDATSSSLTLTDKKLGIHRYDVVVSSSKKGSIGSATVQVSIPVK